MQDTYEYGNQINYKSDIGGISNMKELEYERKIA